MNNKILNKAFNTFLFQQLFQKYDVIMVAIGGSQLVNLDDENSDYDLNFFVTDNCSYLRVMDNWCICIDGKTVHAYICPLRAIELSHTGFAASLIKQTKLTKNHIVWVNSSYSCFIKKWLELTPQLGYIGLLKYRELLKIEPPSKNTYSYLLGADWLLDTKYGIEFAKNWKQNYEHLDHNTQQVYQQAFNNINNLLDQTGDSWKDLWKQVYELLKKTL